MTMLSNPQTKAEAEAMGRSEVIYLRYLNWRRAARYRALLHEAQEEKRSTMFKEIENQLIRKGYCK